MSERRQQVYVTLRYIDAPAAIGWLKRTLGFVENEIHAADDGTIGGAQLAFGNGLIMLGSGDEDSSPQTVYLANSNVDGLYQTAVTGGAEVARAIEDMDYGSREFAVADPEGNTWAVGSYQSAAE